MVSSEDLPTWLRSTVCQDFRCSHPGPVWVPTGRAGLGSAWGRLPALRPFYKRKLTAPVFSRCQPTWSCLSTFTLVLERTTPGQMRRWWMFSITLKQAQSCSFRKPGITIWALSKQFHLQLYRKLQAQKWRGNRAKLQGKPAKLRIPKNASTFKKIRGLCWQTQVPSCTKMTQLAAWLMHV